MTDRTEPASPTPTPEQVAASPMFTGMAELMSGVAEVTSRKLAVMKRAAADLGDDADPLTRALIADGIATEEGLLRMLGGDPDAVGGDHVMAWVLDDTGTGVTYGFNPLPAELCAVNPDTGRMEVPYSAVAHLLAR